MAKFTQAQAEAKVFELTKELLKQKLNCKDTVAGYKDKIKDIESEIKAVVEEQNNP